jgi:hypothetical protein
MADDRWDNADAEGKLEILRQDITDIASAQNALAREFRDLAHRLATVTGAVAALVGTPQTTEAELS